MATMMAGRTQAIVVYLTTADQTQGTRVFIQMTDPVLVTAVCTTTGLALVMEVCTAMIGRVLAVGACTTTGDPTLDMEANEERSSDTCDRGIVL